MTNVLSHAEIVIVGTGPSGMSAAAALCSKGKGILVIDKAKPIPNSYHLADLEMQKRVESGQHLPYLEKILRSRLVKGTPKKFY